jgi:hypothetical protein
MFKTYPFGWGGVLEIELKNEISCWYFGITNLVVNIVMLSFSFKIANVEEKVKDNLSVKPYTLYSFKIAD